MTATTCVLRPPTTVLIQRTGQELKIYLPRNSTVFDRIYTVQHELTGNSSIAPHKVPLVQPPMVWKPDGRRIHPVEEFWTCGSGLFPIVRKTLERAGYSVQCSDCVRPVLETPKTLPERLCDRKSRTIIETVRCVDRLLFRYADGGCNPVKIIAQVAHAWPDRSIMVWTKSPEEARSVARQLRGHKVDAAWYAKDSQPEKRPQVAVAAAYFFSHSPEVQRRELAFVLHADQISQKHALEAVKFAFNARLYGFLSQTSSLSPRVRDYIWAVFGFLELQIAANRAIIEPVDVVTVPYSDSAPLVANESAFQIKRRLIWTNRQRNTAVATLARAIAYGFAGPQELPERSLELVRRYGGQETAILVESLEHAAALSELLPEASIVTAGEGNLHGLSSDVVGRLERDSRRRGIRIVTSAALGRFSGADVLIQADGAFSGPSGDWINVYSQSRVIVDIADRSHPQLRKWRRNRLDAYARLKWAINSKSKPAFDVFDSTRPEDCP